MKKRIIIEAGKPERIVPAGFDLLALLSASYGLLLLVQAVDGVRIDLRIAVPLVSVPGVSLWLLRRMKRPYWFWIGFLAEASAAVIRVCAQSCCPCGIPFSVQGRAPPWTSPGARC